MQVRREILALALSVPTLVGAGEFDGIYRQTSTSDCSAVGEQGGALQIRDGRFIGVDSTCRMLHPVNVRDMNAKLFDMECARNPAPNPSEAADTAENAAPVETPSHVNTVPWRERALLMMAADGGLIMLWNGYAFKYDRCSEADVIDSAVQSAR